MLAIRHGLCDLGTYGESDGDGALHTLIAEDLGEADVLERLGALEGTVGTCSLCVDDSLDINLVR